jgi:hypothetical protein
MDSRAGAQHKEVPQLCAARRLLIATSGACSRRDRNSRETVSHLRAPPARPPHPDTAVTARPPALLARGRIHQCKKNSTVHPRPLGSWIDESRQSNPSATLSCRAAAAASATGPRSKNTGPATSSAFREISLQELFHRLRQHHLTAPHARLGRMVRRHCPDLGVRAPPWASRVRIGYAGVLQ